MKSLYPLVFCLSVLAVLATPARAQAVSSAAFGSTVSVYSGHTTVRERTDAGVNERIELWNRTWIVSPSGQVYENTGHWGLNAPDGYAATTVTFNETGRWSYWASDGGSIDAFVYGDGPFDWYMWPHNPPNGVGYGGWGRRLTTYIDVGAGNTPPTIVWTSVPGTVASGQNYTVSARGHDADGNLAQVNVWKNGTPFAFSGGGNGTAGDSGNATSDGGPATIVFTATAVDSTGASSATISQTVTIAAANSAPTIVWTATPGSAASGQNYTVSARGHDADGNLAQVNVWKNGAPFAFSGGGNGTEGDSGNSTSDSGPATITFTATAVDSTGANSATISQTVTIAAPPTVSASIGVNPPSAIAPGAATVTWSSANATDVAVTGTGVSESSATGSRTVGSLPAGSHIYTIVAQGPGGPVTRTATITVDPPANHAPTIVWTSIPGTVASGQTYTISAQGHDADGNLSEVNIWRNGSPHAFSGGGNGTHGSSGNPSTDTGPSTVVFTAEAVDVTGARSGLITQTVIVAAPATVSAAIAASPIAGIAPGATTITWSSADATAVSVAGTGLASSAANGGQIIAGLPVGTHTYTLTAQGAGGPITRTATFTVASPANTVPTIAWNTAPGTVASGQSYTISAHGHDADGNLTEVNVWRDGVPYAFAGGGNGTDGESGNSSTDTGPLSVTYTAAAVDSHGARSATISQTVIVAAPASVAAAISVSPNATTAPGSTIVTWSSANAAAVEVAGIGLTETATAGSRTVSGLPAGIHTYTIVAQGPGGPATDTATVTVAAAANTAPTIAWTSIPGAVPSGQSYAVSARGHDPDGNLTHVRVWRNGAPFAVAGGGDGTANNIGSSSTDTGPATVVYTAEATDAAGLRSPTISQTVTIAAPPAVTGSIVASPTTTTAPGSATLAWTTSNATAVSVTGNGLISTAENGIQTVSGLAVGSHTYTLTAHGPGGPVTRTATVTVNGGPNVSGSITVSPGSMTLGGMATVSWTTAHATFVRVVGFGITGTSQENSANFTVNVGGLNPGRTTWTLIADGPGGPITRTATIDVTTTDGLYGSLTANPTVIYSNQSATLSWTTTGTDFRWVHGYWPGLNGVNVYPAAVTGSSTVSGLSPGNYRFVIEYGPGSSTTRMSFADLTVLGVNRTVVTSTAPVGAGSVTGAGIYMEGTSATLVAVPDATHVFAGWTGDLTSAANPVVFTVGAQNYNVVANFALQTFAVTAAASPVGAGTITGSGNYPVGTVATLSATPDPTHTFTGWSGDLSSAANPLSFTVSGATNLIANFAPNSFALTTTAGSGGTVTPGGTYTAGTVVTVAATPDATHRFSGWAGDASGVANSVAVTMDRAKFVQANFAAKAAQTITFNSPGDHGLASPPFTLVANATSGLPVSFFLLSGPAILTGNSVEVTGAGPVTIQASQPGDAFFLPAAPVTQSFNVIAAATLKYRGQSRTLLRDATTREAPPFVLEKP